MRKILKALPLFFLTVFGLVNCGGGPNNDIVILYTNDVHCAYDTNIGYSGVAALKQEMQAKSKYVTLVDSGDFSQGSVLGTLTSGSSLVRLMNDAKYDLAILGNHEFDYGMDTLTNNLKSASFKVVCSNMTYTGQKPETSMLKNTVPYEIVEYGNTKIGYIGVTTPLSYTKSAPKNFEEDGERAYFFKGEGSGEELANQVQTTINQVREQNVNYVILLTHLGIVDESDHEYEFSSKYLANHTKGVDAILDGHSHTVMERLNVKNIEGKDVPISQTGTGFTNVGKLTIKNGNFDFKLIDKYEKKDSYVSGEIAIIKDLIDAFLNVKVSHTNFDLTTLDKDGIRMVRSRETNLGDLVADAFREEQGTQIAFVNGGAVRGDQNKTPPIPQGDITYKSAVNVSPFNNMLCSVELKGQDILDMFEYFVMNTEKDYKGKSPDTGEDIAIGESGSFAQVSGLKYKINTKVTSPAIVKPGTEIFDHVDPNKPRRISEMKVLENGEYVDIDKDTIYQVTSTDFIIKNGGCGMVNFLKGKKIIKEGVADNEALINFFTKKSEIPSEYQNPQGRIEVIYE